LKIQEHTQFQKLPLTGTCVTDTPQVCGSGKLLFMNSMWFGGLWWHIFIFNFTHTHTHTHTRCVLTSCITN